MRGSLLQNGVDIDQWQGVQGDGSQFNVNASGGRFGERAWFDDDDTASSFNFDYNAIDWTGNTVFITMQIYIDGGDLQDIPTSVITFGPTSSSDEWSFQVHPNGAWVFKDDNNNRTYTTINMQHCMLHQLAWNTVEISVAQHSSAGLCTIKINGVVCMNAVDVGDTGGAAAWDELWFKGAEVDSTAQGVMYGDIIVCDDTGATFNDFVGDFRFEVALPDADGTTVDWTRNTGASDYLAVDDAEHEYDDDTTYLESTTIDQDSYMTYPAATLTDVDTILFVALVSLVRDDEGSAPLSVAHIVESNASVDVGATKAVILTYEFVVDMFETDPNGSIAWTKTSIDAAEYGIRSKT
jgi:hypothetical protein